MYISCTFWCTCGTARSTTTTTAPVSQRTWHSSITYPRQRTHVQLILHSDRFKWNRSTKFRITRCQGVPGLDCQGMGESLQITSTSTYIIFSAIFITDTNSFIHPPGVKERHPKTSLLGDRTIPSTTSYRRTPAEEYSLFSTILRLCFSVKAQPLSFILVFILVFIFSFILVLYPMHDKFSGTSGGLVLSQGSLVYKVVDKLLRVSVTETNQQK